MNPSHTREGKTVFHFLFLPLLFILGMGAAQLRAQTPTATVQDTARYSFENGTTQGFTAVTLACCPSGNPLASNTTVVAYAGIHSVAISITNWNNLDSFVLNSSTGGDAVSNVFHAWVLADNSNIECQMFVKDSTYTWQSLLTYQNTIAGIWTGISWDTGAGYGADTYIGIKFINNTGSSYTGTIYVDSIDYPWPTPTTTPTQTATSTMTTTPTATPTYTPSNTPTFTKTSTPTSTPTATPTQTSTFTLTFTSTRTQTSTPTFTQTPSSTSTPTITPTPTPTQTSTFTLTFTSTRTQTSTPTFTKTSTPTFTQTASPTFTQTVTPTFTPSNTSTFTQTLSPTATLSPTQTLSPTPTPTPPAPVPNKPYVYANPSQGPTVNFVYSMAESGTAQITLLNDGGDVVATVSEPKPAGYQKTTMDIHQLASGHYFYMIVLKYDSGRVQKLPAQVLAIRK